MKLNLKALFVVILLSLFSMAEVYAQNPILGSFEFEERNRNYEIYLPQDFESNMPLIISLHGYTETISWYKTYTILHEVANTAGFIIVYPAAIDNSWNSGLIAPGWPEIDTTVNDVGFISALIDTLKAHYDIDMSRVYCCGYSLGGEMTYKLTGELGHCFAAVASVTGLLNENSVLTCNPVRPFPILHFHGRADTYETWEGDN
jgi:polyhydroxybutyrate depolymerase